MDKILWRILGRILEVSTPAIVQALREAIEEGKKRAAETPNPADDLLFMILEALLGVPEKSD